MSSVSQTLLCLRTFCTHSQVLLKIKFLFYNFHTDPLVSQNLHSQQDFLETQTFLPHRLPASIEFLLFHIIWCVILSFHTESLISLKKKFPASIQTGVSHTLLSKRFLSGSKTLFPHQTSKTSCFLTSPCFLIDFLYSNILYFLTDFLFPWKFPIKRISISYKTSRFHTYSQSGL